MGTKGTGTSRIIVKKGAQTKSLPTVGCCELAGNNKSLGRHGRHKGKRYGTAGKEVTLGSCNKTFGHGGGALLNPYATVNWNCLQRALISRLASPGSKKENI